LPAEDLSEALGAEIEAHYDRTMDMSQELFDQAAASGADQLSPHVWANVRACPGARPFRCSQASR
jgi:hypothetical protein